jgi:hypothetical protein
MTNQELHATNSWVENQVILRKVISASLEGIPGWTPSLLGVMSDHILSKLREAGFGIYPINEVE